ncbi:crotonobetainyl-CoA:carnitine CoA-transferase CaiB-like acyl-CoA transferase [Murinocardiopsis flavida]|uniref:Crotonobetainyl-CoA:carnitine CoA-transferase CaiB-like acyl-CoA transferase n=1 Tax=Murinocardiopsis flavida TaxID=645275 RepID=A0A2P8DS48_9ACTN|nr:CoA transferase [Murinocardiopsis flavida]PSL00043.1 crotonobetainyl-CoA:carnitine CoA-transferase CaiB-like acyl-CoA transferase [Murinocardiopsis flavida]
MPPEDRGATPGGPPLLDGIRVLDLTNVLAGPFAGYQLALMGADVVKVEVPGSGDLARRLGGDPGLNADLLGASFLAQNGGKRSITLDLKSEGGREVFTRMVRGADVLLENFRPGVLERLGFGWDALRAANPGLVYCAVSGFGQTGPLRDRPAYDQIIQGLSGMMSTTGTAGATPLRAGYPVADTLGGFAAAFGVCAALVRRQSTGQGAFLDVSMLETALTALGWAASNHLLAGLEPTPMGNENATAAPSGTFATASGDLNIAANKQQQFTALCALIGRPDLPADPRFAGREDRKANRDALRAEIEDALAARPALEWEELLSDAGVPAARVLGVAEALRLDHLAEREFVHEVDFPGAPGESMRVLGSGVRVDGGPARPSARPPLLGEHTGPLLRELGYTDDDIDRLAREGVT